MTMPDRLRWGDDRIGDTIGEIRGDIRDLQARLSRAEIQVVELKERVTELSRQEEQLQRAFARRTEERSLERATAAKDRKADIRWMVVTVLTAAGLVIGALALFIHP